MQRSYHSDCTLRLVVGRTTTRVAVSISIVFGGNLGRLLPPVDGGGADFDCEAQRVDKKAHGASATPVSPPATRTWPRRLLERGTWTTSWRDAPESRSSCGTAGWPRRSVVAELMSGPLGSDAAAGV
jgi:hypothetical protein